MFHTFVSNFLIVAFSITCIFMLSVTKAKRGIVGFAIYHWRIRRGSVFSRGCLYRCVSVLFGF